MSKRSYDWPGTLSTGYYGNAKNYPADCKLVGISRGLPRFCRVDVADFRLAPSREMMRMSREDYITNFDAILSGLDASTIYNELGPRAILLCYEKPWEFCHRRAVAEWFETELGVVVPEIGFDRSEAPAFRAMSLKSQGAKPKQSSRQGCLFT